jgi:hypothetical protein
MLIRLFSTSVCFVWHSVDLCRRISLKNDFSAWLRTKEPLDSSKSCNFSSGKVHYFVKGAFLHNVRLRKSRMSGEKNSYILHIIVHHCGYCCRRNQHTENYSLTYGETADLVQPLHPPILFPKISVYKTLHLVLLSRSTLP